MSKDSGLFTKMSLREKVLIALLAVGAFAEEVLVDGMGLNSSDVRASLNGYSLEEINYFKEKRKVLKYTLLRLLRKRWVENKKTSRGSNKYNLTPDGLDFLFSKFPVIRYHRWRWDGYWRMVVYDIRESEKKLRSRLRTFLKNLGFLYIQKSVWITVYPVEKDLEKFLKKEGLWGNVIACKTILSPIDSQKLLPFFYKQLGTVRATPTEKELVKNISHLFPNKPPIK